MLLIIEFSGTGQHQHKWLCFQHENVTGEATTLEYWIFPRKFWFGFQADSFDVFYRTTLLSMWGWSLKRRDNSLQRNNIVVWSFCFSDHTGSRWNQVFFRPYFASASVLQEQRLPFLNPVIKNKLMSLLQMPETTLWKILALQRCHIFFAGWICLSKHSMTYFHVIFVIKLICIL